jgi:hypothetical protein
VERTGGLRAPGTSPSVSWDCGWRRPGGLIPSSVSRGRCGRGSETRAGLGGAWPSPVGGGARPGEAVQRTADHPPTRWVSWDKLFHPESCFLLVYKRECVYLDLLMSILALTIKEGILFQTVP